MKPDKYTEKLKEYRAASQRIGELYHLIWNLPPVDVSKERIFAGDWRYFVVRRDIMRSSIGENIQTVVDATQNAVLGRRENPDSYKRMNYHTRKLEAYQKLRELSDKEFQRHSFTEGVSKYFCRSSEVRSFGSKNIVIYSWVPIVPSWMLEFEYKPAYMLSVSDAGYELQSELDRLNAFMKREDAYRKLSKYNYEYDYENVKNKLLQNIEKKELKEEYN